MASQLEAKTKAMRLGERIPNTPEGWPQAKIRSTFVEYFQRHAHTHWPSSSVVPHDDPTLLFANAGMNQYKSIFLGHTQCHIYKYERKPADYTPIQPLSTLIHCDVLI